MGCVEIHYLLEERHEAAPPSGGKVKALGVIGCVVFVLYVYGIVPGGNFWGS